MVRASSVWRDPAHLRGVTPHYDTAVDRSEMVSEGNGAVSIEASRTILLPSKVKLSSRLLPFRPSTTLNGGTPCLTTHVPNDNTTVPYEGSYVAIAVNTEPHNTIPVFHVSNDHGDLVSPITHTLFFTFLQTEGTATTDVDWRGDRLLSGTTDGIAALHKTGVGDVLGVEDRPGAGKLSSSSSKKNPSLPTSEVVGSVTLPAISLDPYPVAKYRILKVSNDHLANMSLSNFQNNVSLLNNRGKLAVALHSVTPYSVRVNCVKMHPLHLSNHFFIATENDSIALWDFHRVSNPVTQWSRISRSSVTTVDWNIFWPDVMMIGTDTGSLQMIDIRQANVNESGNYIRFQDLAHDGGILSVKYSPLISHWVASSGRDCAVNIWDMRMIKPRQPIYSLTRNRCPIVDLDWNSSHCEMLAGASSEGMKLWDLTMAPSFQLCDIRGGAAGGGVVEAVSFSSTSPFQCNSINDEGVLSTVSLTQEFLDPLATKLGLKVLRQEVIHELDHSDNKLTRKKKDINPKDIDANDSASESMSSCGSDNISELLESMFANESHAIGTHTHSSDEFQETKEGFDLELRMEKYLYFRDLEQAAQMVLTLYETWNEHRHRPFAVADADHMGTSLARMCSRILFVSSRNNTGQWVHTSLTEQLLELSRRRSGIVDHVIAAVKQNNSSLLLDWLKLLLPSNIFLNENMALVYLQEMRRVMEERQVSTPVSVRTSPRTEPAALAEDTTPMNDMFVKMNGTSTDLSIKDIIGIIAQLDEKWLATISRMIFLRKKRLTAIVEVKEDQSGGSTPRGIPTPLSRANSITVGPAPSPRNLPKPVGTETVPNALNTVDPNLISREEIEELKSLVKIMKSLGLTAGMDHHQPLLKVAAELEQYQLAAVYAIIPLRVFRPISASTVRRVVASYMHMSLIAFLRGSDTHSSLTHLKDVRWYHAASEFCQQLQVFHEELDKDLLLIIMAFIIDIDFLAAVEFLAELSVILAHKSRFHNWKKLLPTINLMLFPSVVDEVKIDFDANRSQSALSASKVAIKRVRLPDPGTAGYIIYRVMSSPELVQLNLYLLHTCTKLSSLYADVKNGVLTLEGIEKFKTGVKGGKRMSEALAMEAIHVADKLVNQIEPILVNQTTVDVVPRFIYETFFSALLTLKQYDRYIVRAGTIANFLKSQDGKSYSQHLATSIHAVALPAIKMEFTQALAAMDLERAVKTMGQLCSSINYGDISYFPRRVLMENVEDYYNKLERAIPSAQNRRITREMLPQLIIKNDLLLKKRPELTKKAKGCVGMLLSVIVTEERMKTPVSGADGGVEEGSIVDANLKEGDGVQSSSVDLDVVDLLATVDLFEDLGESDLAGLSSIAEVVRVKPDGILLRQGLTDDSIYILSDGSFVNEILAPDWITKTIDDVPTSEDGTVIGIVELIFNLPRTSTIRAVEPLVVYKFTKSSLLPYLRRGKVRPILLRQMITAGAEVTVREGISLTSKEVTKLVDSCVERFLSTGNGVSIAMMKRIEEGEKEGADVASDASVKPPSKTPVIPPLQLPTKK